MWAIKMLGLISTRTPHAGSDPDTGEIITAYKTFQPALPMRGVTTMSMNFDDAMAFQPALPMRGVTSTREPRSPARGHFNPHSPCGE